ncbi:rRNA pseudouridine synthase [Deinococcus metallilatus]|uniref:Pseudouridine synthase n=1 Tax=Deinococcus metallilatus TaxID=1211322 RepID=A0AAE5YQV5_9DEIO|nr:pseudouridine synthase [Deinococcus metallilatus]MBB5295258.1 23S rRNA pseudouridine2605 synthase [Deinococcus metallilatus]QBY08581.1 rRNA pseudouridine synthase [Deinococcus metallilatus]RXJ10843.1 rRNA pseudouridine synthase [Deinococcus metallilatus]TLK22178.1 rRNA pseudouridine synthase [Deinococcus metallilatus]GMA15033.1 pseudouridine synthase [Deinococcus metallilatus]
MTGSRGPDGGERLQKRLARAGVASRRAAEELITAGRVTVNGEVATLGRTVTPADEVRVDGTLIETAGLESVTFLLYKPAGYVTTARDEYGRRNVLSAMPSIPGLHPVGRLDRDSEGLLLLTTDGQLTLTLTHPRYGHEKAYRAWTAGDEVPTEAELRRLEEGVELEDGPARALSARPAQGGAFVTLGEGRNRQVRRMLDAIGHPVTRLLRYRVGGLWLGDLAPGEYRELSSRDLHDLLNPAQVPRHVWERAEREMLARWG